MAAPFTAPEVARVQRRARARGRRQRGHARRGLRGLLVLRGRRGARAPPSLASWQKRLGVSLAQTPLPPVSRPHPHPDPTPSLSAARRPDVRRGQLMQVGRRRMPTRQVLKGASRRPWARRWRARRHTLPPPIGWTSGRSWRYCASFTPHCLIGLVPRRSRRRRRSAHRSSTTIKASRRGRRPRRHRRPRCRHRRACRACRQRYRISPQSQRSHPPPPTRLRHRCASLLLIHAAPGNPHGVAEL